MKKKFMFMTERNDKVRYMTKKTFEQFHFAPFIKAAIQEAGFKEPTEIQKEIFPVASKGESVIGQSQTGSGKTHAYLFPTLQVIDTTREEVQLVIVAPTRELGRQIYQEIEKITAHCDEDKKITARCFVGGTDKKRSIDKLKKQPHVVVGTPSRIADLVKEGALLVHTASQLVIDEADLMLDMGFIHDVDRVAAKMNKKLQMLVFSATIPQKLKPFLKKYMENPVHVHINPKQISVLTLEHRLVPTKQRNKINVLVNVMSSLQPYLAIIFTNTKQKADEVADALAAKGKKVGRLHGGLAPRARKKMMDQIQDLQFEYIVATDLAARGIDIDGVSHVINYELPTDLDFYIHRVGRTARAGFSGIAITLYGVEDDYSVSQLESRGITFTYMDVKDGHWVDLGERHKRKNRPKTESDVEKTAKRLIKKPKTVKPGYKRKMKWDIEDFKKKERRRANTKGKKK